MDVNIKCPKLKCELFAKVSQIAFLTCHRIILTYLSLMAFLLTHPPINKVRETPTFRPQNAVTTDSHLLSYGEFLSDVRTPPKWPAFCRFEMHLNMLTWAALRKTRIVQRAACTAMHAYIPLVCCRNIVDLRSKYLCTLFWPKCSKVSSQVMCIRVTLYDVLSTT